MIWYNKLVRLEKIYSYPKICSSISIIYQIRVSNHLNPHYFKELENPNNMYIMRIDPYLIM